jgi:hypothetical protein
MSVGLLSLLVLTLIPLRPYIRTGSRFFFVAYLFRIALEVVWVGIRGIHESSNRLHVAWVAAVGAICVVMLLMVLPVLCGRVALVFAGEADGRCCQLLTPELGMMSRRHRLPSPQAKGLCVVV